MLRPIDPHVHLRWNEYPEGCDWAIEDAHAIGLAGLCEMPNTDPPLTDSMTVMKRIYHISEYIPHFVYKPHVGTTSNAQAFLQQAWYAKNRGLALKIYFGPSTGDMEILDRDYQKWMWQSLKVIGYTGVVMMHCEDPELFIPVAQTHPLQRPMEAEIESVNEQLRFARDAGFEGTFYVCHVTQDSVIDLLNSVSVNTVAEVSWHHMFLNYEDDLGIGKMQMNPPLRSKKTQEELLEWVINGKVDLIGSDHAPHPDPDGVSGIPTLPFWKRGCELLLDLGIDSELLDQMIFKRAKKLFDFKMKEDEWLVDYKPELWEKYGFNPFKRVQ